MRKRVLLLVSLALAMMLLASGVALAKNITGTDQDSVLIGTKKADRIVGGAGDDVVRGKAGNDSIWGGDGEDTLYGGKGRDRIHTAGRYADVVDCGPGRDWVTVDSTDQAVNCEKMIHEDPSVAAQSVDAQSEAAPDAD